MAFLFFPKKSKENFTDYRIYLVTRSGCQRWFFQHIFCSVNEVADGLAKLRASNVDLCISVLSICGFLLLVVFGSYFDGCGYNALIPSFVSFTFLWLSVCASFPSPLI